MDGLRRPDPCEPDCLHGTGIDNGGGYDRVRIVGGTVNDFEHGVRLVGARRNALLRLTVSAAADNEVFVPVALIGSDENNIVDSEMGAGEPALLLSGSDHNRVAGSRMRGGISIRQGDGLAIVSGSDGNTFVDDQVSGDGNTVRVADSARNRFARNAFGGDTGVSMENVKRTVVVYNAFGPARGALRVSGDGNVVEGNVVRDVFGGGIGVAGDHNTVQRNVETDVAFVALSVSSGHANLVRNNLVVYGEGLRVAAGARQTRVIGNYVVRSVEDGIQVDAPGTVLGRNTANYNLGLGIDAVAGVVDAGGNMAKGNGNPLQCVNVFCR